MKTLIWICDFSSHDAQIALQRIYEIFKGKSYFSDIIPIIQPPDILSEARAEIGKQPVIMVIGENTAFNMGKETEDIMKVIIASLDMSIDVTLVYVPAKSKIIPATIRQKHIPVRIVTAEESAEEMCDTVRAPFGGLDG